MLEKGRRAVDLSEEAADGLLQRQELLLQRDWQRAVAGVVGFGNDQDVAGDQRRVVASGIEGRRLRQRCLQLAQRAEGTSRDGAGRERIARLKRIRHASCAAPSHVTTGRYRAAGGCHSPAWSLAAASLSDSAGVALAGVACGAGGGAAAN